MAVEITPVMGCRICAGATCPRCLGCLACQTYAAGCVCPADEMPEQAEYLTARHRHAAHVADCFACSLDWATDCDEGQALRSAVDAAWECYLETPAVEGVGTAHVTRSQRRYEETGR